MLVLVYNHVCDVFQELKLLLHRSTLLHAQGRTDDYIDTVLTMLSMLLKVRFCSLDCAQCLIVI